MIFGLAAALGWGISTVAAAAATGRGGTYVALLIAQWTGAAVLLATSTPLIPCRPFRATLDPPSPSGQLISFGFFGVWT